ncbi:MAG TPA: PHP-associated domain-containing protein [Dehalococcoidia bacterium]|nr:PHP-associated domain-containing protein [Dehalococcoidia bacterium]
MTGTIVDMHVHTTRGASDSNLTVDQLVAEAARIGLTGVNISEHDRKWDANTLRHFREENPDLFVNNGMEVSTDLGHMIVVGLDEYYPGIRNLRTLREIADQKGAYVICAHPFRYFFDPVHFRRQGREPFNLTPEQAAEQMPVFGLVDDVEVLNGACTARENEFAYAVAQVLGKKGTGGSDAHSTNGLGVAATAFPVELRDESHMLELLREAAHHPVGGLNRGETAAFTGSSA